MSGWGVYCSDATGPHHLLTAFYLLQPEDKFVKHLKEGTGCHTKILEFDSLFRLQEDERPENTARWNREGEYQITHSLPDLDAAVLYTKKTHLVTRLCLQPICGGVTRVFRLDLRNYFCQQAHSGHCWAAEESSGEYHIFFDSLAEKGFSGGLILGISSISFVSISSDRHAAAVGIVLSDAGKQRTISCFVSLATVFNALSKKDLSWAENVKYVESKNIYSPVSRNVPWGAESSSSGSPISGRSRVVSVSTSTASPLDPSPWPETFTKDISTGMDSVLLRAQQYKRFVDDREGGRELRSGESEQADSETAGSEGPPIILNWRIRRGFSKVQGRVFP